MEKFKYEIDILLSNKRFIDALNYVQDNFYCKQYDLCINDTCVYTDAVIYKEEFTYNQDEKQDIHRPNNGLAHAFRSAVLTYVLSDMYNKRADRIRTQYGDVMHKGAKKIDAIGTAIGALFLKTGRKHDGSMSKYTDFSKFALTKYTTYLLFYIGDKITYEEIKKDFICIAIKEAYKKENPVSQIFEIVNKLELVRCCDLSSDETLDEEFKKICDEKEHLPEVVKLSLELLNITGDRIELIDNINLDFAQYKYYGSLKNLLNYVTDNNDRRNETFYKASFSVMSLLGLIPELKKLTSEEQKQQGGSGTSEKISETPEQISVKANILTTEKNKIIQNIEKLEQIIAEKISIHNQILKLEKARLASIEKVLPQQGGGHYKEKYLKYKNKYLELRQRAGKELSQNLRGGATGETIELTAEETKLKNDCIVLVLQKIINWFIVGGTIEETRRNDKIEILNDEGTMKKNIIYYIYKVIRDILRKNNIPISPEKISIIFQDIMCRLKEAHTIYKYEGGKDDYRFNKSIRDFIQTKLDESPIISKCEKN